LIALIFVISLIQHALASFSWTRLQELANSRRRQTAEDLLANREYLTWVYTFLKMGLLLGLFIYFIQVFRLASGLASSPWHWVWGVALTLVGGGIVCDLLGQTVSRYNSERLLLAMYPLLNRLATPALVLLPLMRKTDSLVRRISGADTESYRDEIISDQIEDVVTAGLREGSIEENAQEMIRSIIEFQDLRVSEVMTPRTELISIDASASLADARDMYLTTRKSKIPVHRENRDSILGIFYANDLLTLDPKIDLAATPVTKLIRPPQFVPETKSISSLMPDLKAGKFRIGIVVDEYGGTAGIVTLEDIVEEIVGEISGEYEPPPAEPITLLDENAAEMDAAVRIPEANDELHIELPEEEDYTTVGGFATSVLGHIPKIGESFTYDHIRFTITEADARRIKRLKIERLPAG
jgi:CBS domain containing-hemolysin-like protein